jgi:hypothetical protein
MLEENLKAKTGQKQKRKKLKKLLRKEQSEVNKETYGKETRYKVKSLLGGR